MLSTDLRKFGIRGLLLMMTTIAAAFGLSPHLVEFQQLLLIGVCSLWGAVAILTLSDVVDHRPVDSRIFVAKVLNGVGIIGLVLSAILVLGVLVLNLAFAIAIFATYYGV